MKALILSLLLATAANAQVFSHYDPATGDVILDIAEQVTAFTVMISQEISPDNSIDYRFRTFSEHNDGQDYIGRMVISDWAIPGSSGYTGTNPDRAPYGFVYSNPWTDEYVVWQNMGIEDYQPVYDMIWMEVVPEPSAMMLVLITVVSVVALQIWRM